MRTLSTVQRFASMFSTLNLLAILVFRWMPPLIKDVIRSTTLLIIIMLTTVWFSGHLFETYVQLFDSFTVSHDYSRSTKIALLAINDVLFHILPCILIGLPTNPIGLIIAYSILLLWYYPNRNRIQEIYVPIITKKYTNIILMFTGLCVMIYCVFYYL